MLDYNPRIAETEILIYIEGILVPALSFHGAYNRQRQGGFYNMQFTIPISEEIKVLQMYNRIRVSVFRKMTDCRVVFLADGMLTPNIVFDYNRGVVILSANSLFDRPLNILSDISAGDSLYKELFATEQEAKRDAVELRAIYCMISENTRKLSEVVPDKHYEENILPRLRASGLARLLEESTGKNINSLVALSEVFGPPSSIGISGMSPRSYTRVLGNFLLLMLIMDPNSLLYNGVELLYFNLFTRILDSQLIDEVTSRVKDLGKVTEHMLPISRRSSYGAVSAFQTQNMIQHHVTQGGLSWGMFESILLYLGGDLGFHVYPAIKTKKIPVGSPNPPDYRDTSGTAMYSMPDNAMLIVPGNTAEDYQGLSVTKLTQYVYRFDDHFIRRAIAPSNIFYPEEVQIGLASGTRRRLPTRYRVSAATLTSNILNPNENMDLVGRIQTTWDILVSREGDITNIDLKARALELKESNSESYTEYELKNGPIIEEVVIPDTVITWVTNANLDDLKEDQLELPELPGIKLKISISDFIGEVMPTAEENLKKKLSIALLFILGEVLQSYLHSLTTTAKQLMVRCRTPEKYPIYSAPVLLIYNIEEDPSTQRYVIEGSVGNIEEHSIIYAKDNASSAEEFEVSTIDLKTYLKFTLLMQEISSIMWGNGVGKIIKDMYNSTVFGKLDYCDYFNITDIKYIDELFELDGDRVVLKKGTHGSNMQFIKYGRDTADTQRSFVSLPQYTSLLFPLRKDPAFMSQGSPRYREATTEIITDTIISDFADADKLSAKMNFNILQPVIDDPALTPEYFLEKLREYQEKMRYNSVNDQKHFYKG